MSRLNPVNPATAKGPAKQMLDGVQKSMGVVPNIMRTLANSPAALDSYLSQMRALSGAKLDGATRESIALATSGANDCDYCASAHSEIGRKLGLSRDETQLNLRGLSSDQRRAAILEFTRAIVEKRGWVNDADISRVRAAGCGDGEIAEIAATVAMTIFTNYFNHIAETEIDFPRVNANTQTTA